MSSNKSQGHQKRSQNTPYGSKSQNANYKFLPKKHWFAHDYCMMIHDLLAQVVVEEEKAGIFNITIKDESGEFIKKVQNNGERDIVDLLEEDGKFVEIFMLLYNQICLAILSDMAHFIFEALECSKKGKLTVTFSLLRKPLVENLLYLEYLLADPGNFILNFWKGDIDHFALGQNQVINPKNIIKSLYEKYPLPQFEDPEFIHDIRYKKDSDQSFQTYFQTATHLVTQRKFYKTQNTNFNFIYSGLNEKEAQWEGLYSYLPIVMFHWYQVVEALLKLVGRRAGAKLDITDHRIEIGYLLWEKNSHWGNYGKEDKLSRLVEVWDLAQITCDECKSSITPSEENYLIFYERGHVTCASCNSTKDLITPFLELAKEELGANRSEVKL